MKKLVRVLPAGSSHWVGDGFPVKTAFTYQNAGRELSPFLMLDHGGPTSFDATTQRRGVGEHPHRGFETVTIVYQGEVEHRDSSGGGGRIGAGDVQWMTAGSGLVHEEFHGADYAARGGPFEMVQLWVNLPARHKMTAPGYQAIADIDVPKVEMAHGAGTVRLIAGNGWGRSGAARTFTPVQVWDLALNAGATLTMPAVEGHGVGLLMIRGGAKVQGRDLAQAQTAVLSTEGHAIQVDSTSGARILWLSGAPIDEPIVGHGPFVMNTRDEILQALGDYQAGRMGSLQGPGRHAS